MLETIAVAIVAAGLGALAHFLTANNNDKKKFFNLEYEARAKAKAIKAESELFMKTSRIEVEQERRLLEQETQSRISEIDEKERVLHIKSEEYIQKEETCHVLEQKLLNYEKYLLTLEKEKKDKIDEAITKMEHIASYTEEEAKQYILKQVELKSRADIAAIVRKYEEEAKVDGRKKANYILAQAATRYAGDFAGERLINFVELPSETHKGRIIGKEGRNIKSLEMLLGVDIVIDETPRMIMISSFNLYRRAIATRVIEILVEDGTIHPGRIEEVHAKVEASFEKMTYDEGERIVTELGLFPMADELIRLLGRMRYRSSYGQNALEHTLEVAKLARLMTAEMGGDVKLALRAGLLHDIGKALTAEMSGSHVDIGVDLCKRYGEHPSVINAIYAHHGYEEPDSIESASVCAADKLSAARPGARREVMETFTKRVHDIEEIAQGYTDVIDAYAINGGKEVRVFVNTQTISDNESLLLSKEIAKEIEDNLDYPGEIKVNVIREFRTACYAK